MKALLTQLALILGGIVAAISMGINLAQGMDLLSAVFRASLVFFATVFVLFVFLRFFSMILLRFVAEQVLQNRPPVTEEESRATTEPGRKEASAASAARKPPAAS